MMTMPDRTSWRSAALALFTVAWGANMFAPLLQVYRRELSSVEVTGLFGAYAIGLVPALLLLGPVSDRWGRRLVVLSALALSAIGSVVLLLAGESFAGLLAGRILVGVAAGAAFGPGTAWLKELSDRGGSTSSGATRAAIALSSGFALGPLASGAIAQWLPAPGLTPYVTHIVVLALLLPIIRRAPETVASAPRISRTHQSGVRSAVLGDTFLKLVVPTAPWVFGAATTSFVVLPGLVRLGDLTIAAAGATAAVTLGTGVLVQPWARDLSTRSLLLPFRWGAAALTTGMLMAALTASTHLAALLLPSAILLGAAYGLFLVSGLRSVEAVASPADLGRLTGVFYMLTYVGFAFPLIITALAPVLPVAPALLLTAATGAVCSLGTFRRSRPLRDRPALHAAGAPLG